VNTFCIVLAAGDSSRMGRNKLLLKAEGKSFIRKTLEEIRKIPELTPIVVTGFERERIETELAGLDAKFVFNPDFDLGMHTSLKAGVTALSEEAEGFFVCLADQPYFSSENLSILLEAKGAIRVPAYNKRRGHPVYFSTSFVPEILREPDGDYGLGYLLKRHPNKVTEIEVPSSKILVDVDTPEDFEKYKKRKIDSTDPVEVFHTTVANLRSHGETFALATIIEVIGSASARTGSSAIFTKEGKNLLGWVGGGCAERYIGDECVAAIEEHKTRIILADLDDEIFGLGVACGGKMRVFIEPVYPAETVHFPVTDKFRNELRTLSSHYGWNLKDSPATAPTTVEDLLLGLARAAGTARGKSLRPMYQVKETPATFTGKHVVTKRSVTLVGKSRITEALARHFTLLNFKIRTMGPEDYESMIFFPDEVVMIASHTSRDPGFVEKAINAGAAHVAMVGSKKRAEEVLTHLNLMHQNIPHPLYVPAGLDIDARNPDEIALSLIAEVITHLEKS